MGKKGGSGGSQTVTQKADPWIGVQPHLANLYANANNIYNSGPRGAYGGQLSAATTPELLQGWHRTRETANSPSPTFGNAQDALNYFTQGREAQFNPFASGKMFADDPTAQGAYLNSSGNPFMRDMVQAASRPIMENFQNAIAPSLASQFSAAGRMGSGAHLAAAQQAQSILGRQLSDTASGMYGQAYESERGRMEQARGLQQQLMSGALNDVGARRLTASGLAPAFEQARYLGTDRLVSIGQQWQQMEQDRIDREKARYEYNRDEPMMRLAQYNNILSGATPYASSSQQGSSRSPFNPLTGAIGGGLGGYALGTAMGIGGPIGAIGGALLGGLFG